MQVSSIKMFCFGLQTVAPTIQSASWRKRFISYCNNGKTLHSVTHEKLFHIWSWNLHFIWTSLANKYIDEIKFPFSIVQHKIPINQSNNHRQIKFVMFSLSSLMQTLKNWSFVFYPFNPKSLARGIYRIKGWHKGTSYFYLATHRFHQGIHLVKGKYSWFGVYCVNSTTYLYTFSWQMLFVLILGLE